MSTCDQVIHTQLTRGRVQGTESSDGSAGHADDDVLTGTCAAHQSSHIGTKVSDADDRCSDLRLGSIVVVRSGSRRRACHAVRLTGKLKSVYMCVHTSISHRLLIRFRLGT